ncbi:uncharacterized protein LOC143222614 isoform X2 [Tachypleus tridentatus]|uniref:uncharacterized protein LOC143222614 isoform X2 n=1 Tax=Tachypleus tridentatus TaxID=6853 RepID=UPI003FCF577E
MPPNGSEPLKEDSSCFVCTFCYHSLTAQWIAYETSPYPEDSNPWQRQYDTYHFVCFICGITTYRKCTHSISVEDFPFLIEHPRPAGSLTINRGESVITCLTCFESLMFQWKEFECMKVPVELRKYNWIVFPPPPDDDIFQANQETASLRSVASFSEEDIKIIDNFEDISATEELPHGSKTPSLTMHAPPKPGVHTMTAISPLHPEQHINNMIGHYSGSSNSALNATRTSSFAAALRKLAKQAVDPVADPTDVVLKVTFPWASKPTVVRYPWWMEELTLISICFIALCLLCCFCNVNEKARGKWNALKNRVLGSCGVFTYTKLEDQELVTEKITPSELDILEAVSMIPECEKVSTNKFDKRETNMVLKENQTEPTILQTINENHSIEKKTERTENLSKPASGSDKTKLKKCVRTIVNDDKPEETLKSDSPTTAETPKEVKDDERIQREVSNNIRSPSTRRFHNVDKIITVRLGSKPEHHQRNVFIVIENTENRNKFVIGRASKLTSTCQLKRCQSEHKLIVQKPKKNNQIKHVNSPHKIVFTRDPKLEPKPKN